MTRLLVASLIAGIALTASAATSLELVTDGATELLVILGLVVACFCAGWVLALVAPPPPAPPERLVNRLWASRSIWRASR